MLRVGRVTSANGIGRRLEHDDVAGVADEERHAAQLLGAPEQRADVAAQPDAGVDEALEVLRPEIPERRAHDAFLDGDVHEQACGCCGSDGRQARCTTPVIST